MEKQIGLIAFWRVFSPLKIREKNLLVKEARNWKGKTLPISPVQQSRELAWFAQVATTQKLSFIPQH